MSSTKSPAAAGRLTLRMIARHAGVSLAAASMALRNHPRISVSVRRRVQRIAQKLGYHPDPKLATLMQHLRTQGDGNYRETLAYVSSYESLEKWSRAPHYDYFLGAATRALELGYRLDVVHLGEPGMTPRRMSRLLQARGIRGLLIGGFEQPGYVLNLDWNQFAAVAFDYSLGGPVLHRATTNYYLEMLSVLQRLDKEGYRRIGLNANSRDDAKVLGLWQSAYLRYQQQLPENRRLPINLSPDGKGGLHDWLKHAKPDAIISGGTGHFPRDYAEIYHRPAPVEIGYVNMNIAHADASSRGIDKLFAMVGRLACEQVIAQLQRNETGVPEHPQVISIEGEWIEDYDQWKKKRDKWRSEAVGRLAQDC